MKRNYVYSIFMIMVCVFIAGAVVPADALTGRAQDSTAHASIPVIDINVPAVVRTTLPQGFVNPRPMRVAVEFAEMKAAMYSRAFAQGDAVYLEIVVPDAENVTDISAQNGTRGLTLIKRDWGYRAVFSVAPDAQLGAQNVSISYCFYGEDRIIRLHYTVKKTEFQVSRYPLQFTQHSNVTNTQKPEIARRIAADSQKKQQTFASRGEDMLSSALAHPRNEHYVTSPFLITRVYQQYTVRNGQRVNLPDKVHVHNGLDLKGYTGTPVFAMARGKVILSQDMYYEGNFIVLDHGNGIFTYYMHMSSRVVKEGDVVEAGQQIGACGNTGMSAGAHLHVSLYIDKNQVDPMSLLCLPIRE